ncbi:MAG: ShlB/FhaC/HecB family hemolysin secretion/activation protein [Nitrospinae bacterium]|nr:ShlB/FhaC/HecB family hemolysin secretion/activation protein [Nitrospinota bacterium]MZH03876.1 ShlB/FhaC/HecB family hemolysin secretion/activation protein [Nitrospinota bacterium]MZH15306.1 ShlB/FhaC/HecB family hemolysin secretion/activation protein [Nitrospinota bacterium]
MNMVVDLVTANFKKKILLVLAFGLYFSNFWVLPSFAQITPQGRDQTYKQASPLRFEERFKKQAKPKAQKVPVQEDNLKPMFPSELRKVKFVLRKMIIKGSTLYSKRRFSKLFKKYMRKRISLGVVYDIAQTITNMYRNDGYILSKAVVPPQQIERGIIRIDVIEGFVDKVNVQGDVTGPRTLLNRYRKKLLNSKPLLSKDLERYLLLVDDLPGLSVKSVLTPSDVKPGATDLTLILESKKINGGMGVDNRGTKFNGPIQFSANASANSLLKLYERIGFQGVVTKDTDELQFFSGFYEMPVSSEGTKIYFSGSSSKSQPGDDLKQFEVNGDSTTFTLRATHPFIRSRSENLNAVLGFTSRNSTTKFLGDTDSKDKLRIANFGLSYDFVDNYRGVNLVSFNWSQGLGIFGASEQGDPKLSRRQGTSSFTKFSGEALRLQQLAPSWMLLGAMSWQYSFEKLLASEEFGVGGPRFGRAFDASEITGDHGIALKLELQKAFQINKAYIKDIQAYTFIDYGTVWNRLDTSTGVTKQDVTSAGLGFRFNVTDHLSGYLEWDKPLNKDVSSEGNKDARVFFSLSAHF